MKTLEQAREERLDREIDAMIAEKLEGVSLAAVSPTARVKLRGILKKYAKSAHPFRECVRDNTEIETANGPVQIKDLKRGDLVWSQGENGLELRPVLWAEMTRRDADLMCLTVAEGVGVVATPDHLFMGLDGSWVPLRDLESGDAICCSLALSTLARARLAISLAGVDALGDATSMVGPEMPIGTRQGTAFFQLGDLSLLVFVSEQRSRDRIFTPLGKMWFQGSHDRRGSVPVQAPMPHPTGTAVYEVQDAAEEHGKPVECPAILLRRGDEESWRPHSAAAAFAAIEAEAALALQESGGPGDLYLCRVVSVESLEERADVWDIEVAENHCFVAHGLILHNCVRDNLKRFGPGRTEAICASLKDTIKGTTKWRKGGGHAKMSEGEGVVIDADVLLALDAISDIDLQEILLEARALDEYQTVEAVPLLETNGKAEIERWGAGQVELAVLTAKKRKALKPEDFALPPEDYPMEDRAHAINALARGKQHASPEDYKTIKSRVCKRYPGLPACKED